MARNKSTPQMPSRARPTSYNLQILRGITLSEKGRMHIVSLRARVLKIAQEVGDHIGPRFSSSVPRLLSQLIEEGILRRPAGTRCLVEVTPKAFKEYETACTSKNQTPLQEVKTWKAVRDSRKKRKREELEDGDEGKDVRRYAPTRRIAEVEEELKLAQEENERLNDTIRRLQPRAQGSGLTQADAPSTPSPMRRTLSRELSLNAMPRSPRPPRALGSRNQTKSFISDISRRPTPPPSEHDGNDDFQDTAMDKTADTFQDTERPAFNGASGLLTPEASPVKGRSRGLARVSQDQTTIDVQQGGVSRTYVATLEAKVKERDSQIKDLEYRVRDLVRVEEDLLEISKEKNCLHDKLTVRDAALDFCRKGISRLETEIATPLEALRASHSDNKKQATNIQSLTSDLLSEQGRATVLQKKLTDQVSELETLKANAERLESERSSLQTSLKFAEQEVSALKATIQSSETEKLDLQELLNAANTELETCMAELDLRQTSLDDMTSQRDQLQRDLRDEKENLKRAEEYNEALVEVNTRNGDAIDKGNDNRAKLLARFHSMEKAVLVVQKSPLPQRRR